MTYSQRLLRRDEVGLFGRKPSPMPARRDARLVLEIGTDRGTHEVLLVRPSGLTPWGSDGIGLLLAANVAPRRSVTLRPEAEPRPLRRRRDVAFLTRYSGPTSLRMSFRFDEQIRVCVPNFQQTSSATSKYVAAPSRQPDHAGKRHLLYEVYNSARQLISSIFAFLTYLPIFLFDVMFSISRKKL